MKLKHLDTALELKGLTDESDSPWYTLSGYASVFGNTDLDGDIIERGAFEKSLGMREPLLLVNHKMSELPIGKITQAREDEKGLYFEAQLPKDDSFVSGRLAPQLRNGSLKGVSIGFRISASDVIKETGGRRIKQADLFEISVVNLPANPMAQVNYMKAAKVDPDDLLPVQDKAKFWSEQEALARVKAFTASEEAPSEDYKTAFLWHDPDNADDFDAYKFLIADVDGGCLKANRTAVFSASADVLGQRDAGSTDEELKGAVLPVLVAYYEAMNLPSPAEAITKSEYLNLLPRQREARLRAGIPCSKGLSAYLGQRDAGRTRRDAGSTDGQLKELLSLVRQLTAKARDNAS